MIILGLFQYLTSSWWWVIVIPFFSGALYREGMMKATIQGSLIGGIVWTGISVAQFFGSADIVSDKIAAMIGIGQPFLLTIITGVLGFLLGAIAANTGNAIKQYVFPVRQF